MRHYAFLRAINTGARRVTNAELIGALQDHGLDDVAAYQAAGNLTFTAARAIERSELEAAFAAALGFEVPTVLCPAERVERVASATPFDAATLAGTEGRIQVTFCIDPPDADAIAAATALVPDGEHVSFDHDVWFWLPRAGISTSDFPVAKVERILGPMTMRTLGTVERMFARFGSD